MEKEHVIQKLKGRVSGEGIVRGDHNLNPSMEKCHELIPAAVLVPIVEREQGLEVLFTQRTNHLENHPGQVSFPGGHVDSSDGCAEDTALRETEEEVGINRRHITILGRLDRYQVRTGFEVTPVVGLVTPPFEIRRDEYEVAEVFEVPLNFLMDPINHEKQSREYLGKNRHFFAISYKGYYIWGATAGMLVNLYQILIEL